MKVLFRILLIAFNLCFSLEIAAKVDLDIVMDRAAQIKDEKSKIQYLNNFVFNIRERETINALELAIYVDNLAREYGDESLLAKSSGNLGWLYYRIANYKEAYKFSTEAYKLSLKTQQYEDVAMALNNIGGLYVQVTILNAAINSFKEAYFFSLKAKNNFTTIRSLNNLANLYNQTNKLDSANYYLSISKKINSKIDNPYLNGFIERIEGDIYFSSNNYNQALKKYLSALKIANDNQLGPFAAQLYHRLGSAYLKRGEYLKALEYLKEGEELCKKNEYYDELINTYKVMASTYEILGVINPAFNYQKLFNELKEEIQARSDLDKFAFFQGVFESEKSELNSQYYQAENKIKELKLENAERLMILAVISVFIFLCLLVWLSLLNRKLKAINVYLKNDREEINFQKKELEQLSNNLQEVNKTKNLLFSILSHDLRNPVSQLKGIFELLQEDVISKEEFDEISKLLKRNVDGLYSNLDNILIWSKSQLEGFKVTNASIMLEDFIDQSVDFYKSMSDDKGLSFNIILNHTRVISDELLLQSVMRNLINNAIKFSPRNGEITIQSDHIDNSIQIKISDMGQGIDPIKLNQILEESFHLVESGLGTEKESGTGLGLNICKQLLHLINGKLQIKSSVEKGTSVIIVLPMDIPIVTQ